MHGWGNDSIMSLVDWGCTSAFSVLHITQWLHSQFLLQTAISHVITILERQGLTWCLVTHITWDSAFQYCNHVTDCSVSCAIGATIHDTTARSERHMPSTLQHGWGLTLWPCTTLALDATYPLQDSPPWPVQQSPASEQGKESQTVDGQQVSSNNCDHLYPVCWASFALLS